MAATSARAAIRPWRLASRRAPVRHASSSSEAVSSGASRAKEGAANAASKASAGLSRVTSSASSALGRTGPAISGALNKVGGRTGRLISFVQSIIPPTVYYSKVGAELAKMTFRGQNMQPPSIAQFQSYFQPLINGLRNPRTLFSTNPGLLQPQQYLDQARNMTNQQMLELGIIFAQVYGFYEVGKIIGRMKIVGFRTRGEKEEHH